MAIKTVFFDIGDVLFSEDVPHAMLLHSVVQTMHRAGVDVRWDDFLAQFRQCMRLSPAKAVQNTVGSYVPDPARSRELYEVGHDWYQQLRKPRPYGFLQDDITASAIALRQRYRTGIIANQHPVIMEALADYGLIELFDTIVIDEIVGVSKPDPAIFRLALERAGCDACEAIMIGDRPEVDIAPAKRLGMGTIRLRTGTFYVHYDPLVDDERADIELRSPVNIPAAVAQLQAHLPDPPSHSVVPSLPEEGRRLEASSRVLPPSSAHLPASGPRPPATGGVET